MRPITVSSKLEAKTCPVRSVLSKVTGKWPVLILLGLEDGPLRFGELKTSIGDITQRVMTDQLRKLEKDGLIARTVHPGPPVAVSYKLTRLGQSLLKAVNPLIDWSKRNMKKVHQARNG